MFSKATSCMFSMLNNAELAVVQEYCKKQELRKVCVSPSVSAAEKSNLKPNQPNPNPNLCINSYPSHYSSINSYNYPQFIHNPSLHPVFKKTRQTKLDLDWTTPNSSVNDLRDTLQSNQSHYLKSWSGTHWTTCVL